MPHDHTEDAAERVRLRDGSVVLIRPVMPADRELLAQAFERFGMESRMNRFLGAKGELSDAELDFLTKVDHERHVALGAIDPADGAGIGVARLVRPEGSGRCAEAAVAVVDEWQGRGLGAALLERLAARARELGIERFAAVLRTDNRAMMELFRRIGGVRLRRRYGDIAEIEVELPIDGPEDALGTALRSAAAGGVEPVEKSAR